jgi:hypothetical protein
MDWKNLPWYDQVILIALVFLLVEWILGFFDLKKIMKRLDVTLEPTSAKTKTSFRMKRGQSLLGTVDFPTPDSGKFAVLKVARQGEVGMMPRLWFGKYLSPVNVFRVKAWLRAAICR